MADTARFVVHRWVQYAHLAHGVDRRHEAQDLHSKERLTDLVPPASGQGTRVNRGPTWEHREHLRL